MSALSFEQTLIAQQVAGTALSNTTVATSLVPAAAKFTLPANYLQVGTQFRIKAAGRISTVVTAPGTLSLDVRFGSILVFVGGAMALNTAAQTNTTWLLELLLTCQAIGGTTVANLIGTGEWKSRAVIASPVTGAGGVASHLLPDTAPATGNGFDSTAAQIIDLFATWSIANAANSIRMDQFSIEAMN